MTIIVGVKVNVHEEAWLLKMIIKGLCGHVRLWGVVMVMEKGRMSRVVFS